MKNRFLIAAALGSSLFLTDCNKNKGDAAANDSSAITYQLTTSGTTSNLDRMDVSTTGRTEGNAITWTGGYITCNEIRFSAKGHGRGDKDDDDNNKPEFKSKVILHINLFKTIATLGSITVPADIYNKIEFKIELSPSGDQAAFELTGFYIRNGVSVPITLRFDIPIELAFQLAASDNLNINTALTALNTLDLDQLLQGITQQMLNNAVLVNNTIIISSNSNVAMFKIISNSLHIMLKVKVKEH